MATMVELNGGFRGYLGTSDEEKPTDVDMAKGSMFIELDTGDIKYYDPDAGSWLPFGGGA